MSPVENNKRKLLTVVTEAALETTLVTDLDRLHAHGYTIGDVRGKGSRGVRHADWELDASIRVEVVCDAATAASIAVHLQTQYYDNYAMIIFTSDIEVLRPEKF